MRQPIKFLPYLKSTVWGGEEISRFKGLRINCKNIGESWELSAVPGCESIVMDGDDCGMTLADMVRKYKDELVGQRVYSRYGDNFPLLVKFIDARDDLSIQMSHLHTELANYTYRPEVKSGYADDISDFGSGVSATESLVKSDYFQVHKEVVDGERKIRNNEDSFMGLVCIEGNGSLKVDGVSTSVKQGESLLLPAHTDEFDVEGTMALLTIVIPTLMAEAQG
ncbi:MAG: hypothetical protein K2J78_00220 [Muribaculaceae bacterium]|nr:hypothetical protein [Muribaculaceae bacterium]MDE6768130.1 hypothetical protein [Muribaculaceae bacterium]